MLLAAELRLDLARKLTDVKCEPQFRNYANVADYRDIPYHEPQNDNGISSNKKLGYYRKAEQCCILLCLPHYLLSLVYLCMSVYFVTDNFRWLL